MAYLSDVIGAAPESPNVDESAIMNLERVQMLREKVVTQGEKLARLETQRGEIVEWRDKATTAEVKRECARKAGAVFPEISRIRERISHARRLLAHSQGDEYQTSSK